MKHTTLRIVLPLLVAGTPVAAVAQDAPPAGAAPAPDQAAAPSPSETPAPQAAPSDAPAEPTVDERLNELNGKFEGFQESYGQTEATVNALKKIKVSGYIQGRWEWHDDGTYGVGHGENRFFVRRARLKTQYTGENTEYMLQIDAVNQFPGGVVMKDAEASLIDTWTPLNMKLTVGQFKAPFGYEILQSSADREMPERARVIRAMFPGERERGLRLNASYSVIRFSGALVNGNQFLPSSENGGSSNYNAQSDQNSYKDLVGRLGGDFELAPGISWVVGVSGYYGRELRTTPANATNPASYQRFRRERVGADTQIYFDIPEVGGLAIKAEYIWGQDKPLEFQGKPPNPCGVWDVPNATTLTPLDGSGSNKGQGYYINVVQNVGDHLGGVVRWDVWDPNTSALDGCTDPVKLASYANDKVSTIGGGLLVYFGNTKISFIYEHIGEQGARKKDNDIFTAQLQARF